MNKRHMLIYTDGASIDTTIYPSYEEAKANMDKAYDISKTEENNEDSSWLGDYEASLQNEDLELWSIVPIDE